DRAGRADVVRGRRRDLGRSPPWSQARRPTVWPRTRLLKAAPTRRAETARPGVMTADASGNRSTKAATATTPGRSPSPPPIQTPGSPPSAPGRFTRTLTDATPGLPVSLVRGGALDGCWRAVLVDAVCAPLRGGRALRGLL